MTKKTNSNILAQQEYYRQLSLFENELEAMLSNASLFDCNVFYENLMRLKVMTENIEEVILSSHNEFEELTFKCALGAWKNNDIALAKNLATDMMPLFANSSKLGLLLRKLTLSHTKAETKKEKQDNPPLISVVTPLYNQGEYLAETIQSVRKQSYENWEMIVVNDGSTDNSLEIAQQILNDLNDPKIKLLTHANKGKGYTRNRGVKAASGKYICVLDSDDQLAPEYLSTAVEILENSPKTGWVTPKTLVYGATHHLAWDAVEANSPGVIQCISPCSAVYRKQIWEELGGYLEDMTDREDWEFWIRAWEAGWGTSASTEEVLFIYRHAFQRFGTLPHNNIHSKLEMIKLHPWWFKALPQSDVINECCQHSVGRFNENFLNADYLAIAAQLHSNKEELKKFMCWLKLHWQKLYQPKASSNTTNKLRMLIHYIAKGDKAKAKKYLEQIGGQLEDWQSQLLACLTPLIN